MAMGMSIPGIASAPIRPGALEPQPPTSCDRTLKTLDEIDAGARHTRRQSGLLIGVLKFIYWLCRKLQRNKETNKIL